MTPFFMTDKGVLLILFQNTIPHNKAPKPNLYIKIATGVRVVSAILPAMNPPPQIMATINNIKLAISSMFLIKFPPLSFKV
jgi:hypothetical protein